MDEEQFERIASALEEISFGGRYSPGPGGLESIAMSLAGEGLRHPMSDAISEIATAIREGLEEVAEAVRESRNSA
ncbi:MAG TPA: hypothetical protein VKZ89_11770 [Thermobifida alba]|nr:hypothetical protein [Thermobifida alba]